MRLFDWLAPRRRCVVLGCSSRPNGQSSLCTDHERELGENTRRVVERVRATPAERPR